VDLRSRHSAREPSFGAALTDHQTTVLALQCDSSFMASHCWDAADPAVSSGVMPIREVDAILGRPVVRIEVAHQPGGMVRLPDRISEGKIRPEIYRRARHCAHHATFERTRRGDRPCIAAPQPHNALAIIPDALRVT
jgi:hypothetical protein